METEHKLSKLQEAEFEILKVFVDICQRHNLKYFLAGGTFLGAVRHHGFIPWDDDIDVAMPRPDFEKFLEISSDLLPNHLYLSTYKRNGHITLVAQIFNKNKNFTLNNATRVVQTGAWIDILVLDGAPAPGFKRKIFGIKYLYLRMMNQFAHFDEIVNLNKKRPWYETIAIKFAQITKIQKHLDPIRLGDELHNLLRSNPYETSKYVGTFMGAAKMKEIVPWDVYGEGTDCEFEGMILKGPDKKEEFLTHFYGDYMTPPPPTERNRHNVQSMSDDVG